jgi:hypothetical protein
MRLLRLRAAGLSLAAAIFIAAAASAEPPGTPPSLTADLEPKLADELEQIDWMEDKVGDYPFDTYGSFVVNTAFGFALETQTLSLFNINVYWGGALVLFALREEIGDAAFQQLERAWVRKHRDGVASTADFVSLASRIAGRDLGPFLHAWL